MKVILRHFILSTLSLLTMVGGELALAAEPYRIAVNDATLNRGYRSIIEQAFGKLPPTFLATLPPTLEFHLKEGPGRPAEVEGDKVFLRAGLLNAYLADPSDVSFRKNIEFSRHPDFRTFLVAMILHEVSHIFDHKFRISYREQFDLLHSRHVYAADKSANLDQNDAIPQRKRGNYFVGRSVDPYEFKSPQEAFAVGFEFFVLDPSYKCRLPAHYEFYRQTLGWSPSSLRCDSFSKHYYINPSLNGEEAFEPQIASPKGKLYAIHYLVAGAGKGMMSRFGHSMLRLVYCDPDREVATPQCLFDVDQHVVITPAAAVMDLEISQMDGLTGKYPSSFYGALLGATTQLYNRIEERELFSIPLTLTPAQMTELERAVHESHWTYRNKYYFTVNNCATEVLNVMKRAFPDMAQLQSSYSSTPFGLLDVMKQLGLTSDVELEQWRKDATKRFYFPPATKALRELAKFAADHMKSPEVNDYMKLDGAARRKIVHASKNSNEPIRVARALGALEMNLLLKRQMDVFRAVVKDSSLRTSLKTANDEINSQHQSWFAPPTVLSIDHYGVPSNDEIEDIKSNRKAALEKLNSQRTSLFGNLKDSSAQTKEQKLVLESEALIGLLEGKDGEADKK